MAAGLVVLEAPIDSRSVAENGCFGIHPMLDCS
jgi:hypothetical protein